MLHTVRDLEFCKLRNIDVDLDGIKSVANLFGPVRQTHYGISEITEKPTQYNVGDSGLALLPHMDETYRISNIGITLFQVVQAAETGGHSTLVDGFEVARRMKQQHSEEFKLLCDTPIRFHRHHTGKIFDGKQRYLVAHSPVFKLNEEGEVVGAKINERQIAPLDLSANLVTTFYQALRHLFEITYSDDLRIELTLTSGEGMIFDNQRLLHGRTEFTKGKVPRSVRTCTVDTEEYHSTMRLLESSLRQPNPTLKI